MLENDKLERNKHLETLEKNREELVIQKTELQSSKIILQAERDQFENETTKLLKEKRRLNGMYFCSNIFVSFLFCFTEELITARKENVVFRNQHYSQQAKIDEIENEKKLIEADKERWSREKQIFVQNKDWFMAEISNREATINELRMEAVICCCCWMI